MKKKLLLVITLSLGFLSYANAAEQDVLEEQVQLLGEQQEVMQQPVDVDMELEPTVGRIVYVQKNPKNEVEKFVIKRARLTNPTNI